MLDLRRVGPALWLAAALCAAVPASASGAVTIGTDLAAPGMYQMACATAGPCMWANVNVAPANTAAGGLTAPASGVIVRWRLQSTDAASAPWEARLRILVGNKAAGTSEAVEIPDADGPQEFVTRLPVDAGSRLGLELSAPGTLPLFTGQQALHVWDPPIADGQTSTPINIDENAIPLNADIEPDADEDGFGDETQDQCPDDPSIQGTCPAAPDTDPPETTITKGAPKKTDKPKVKFKFTSSEPDSTFECKLDKKEFKPCSSPRKVRNLDEGKHKFKVRATDAAGNVDPSAAKDKFRVVG